MTAGPERAAGSSRALLTLLFLVSGAVGLSYEVAWTRALHTLLGSTAAGSALLLGVFVGALGLGARWAGDRAGRTARPLGAYGLLELLAAAWAVLVLLLAPLAAGPYLAVASGVDPVVRWALRFVLAGLLVGPGAFLLGGTLPFMVRAWPTRSTGAGVAWLYGVNTVGAVLGALATGFFAVDALGVRGALHAAALLGALVGGLALLAGRIGGAEPQPPSRPQPAGDAHPVKAALAAATLCGLFGLAVEVLGFRLLTFFVEGFTTSFAAMLAVFVLGLGLGSLLLGPWIERSRRPEGAVGLLLFLLGAVLLGSLFAVLPGLEGWLGDVRASVYAGAKTPEDLEGGHRLTALLGASALLLLPGLLLGAAFPLCVRWARQAGAEPARALGAVYLANSLGSLLGPIAATFVLVPVLGVVGAWSAVALIALVAGASRLVVWPRTKALSIALAVGVVGSASLGWWHLKDEPDDGDLLGWSHVLRDKPGRRLDVWTTDALTTASVIDTEDGERILYTDDFAAAATGRHYGYMHLLGHLPVLLAAEPTNALVIAFGTGTTAGAVAAHAEVKRIEVAEVSSGVLSLARRFSRVNHGVLHDPRVRVFADDGRDVLALHAPDLDVITLEPLMPYAPAGLPFYTREFYELARDRLRAGGVLCQWVPVHAMRVGAFAALVKTFLDVFPDGTLWFFEQSVALIGVRGGRAPEPGAFERRFAAAGDHLSDAHQHSPAHLLSACIASGATVASRPLPEPDLARRTVRDLDPWPEFHATPRGVLTSYLGDTLRWLADLAAAPTAPVLPVAFDATAFARAREGALAALQARTLAARAEHLGLVAPRRGPGASEAALERLGLLDQAVLHYGRALERLPDDHALTWRRAAALREAAELRIFDLLGRAERAQQANLADEARDLRQAALAFGTAALAVHDGDPSAGRLGSIARAVALTELTLGRCGAALETLVVAQAVLPVGREAEALGRLVAAVRALASGAPPSSDLMRSGLSFPACREEGLGPVRGQLESWQKAWDSGAPARSLRLAAKAFALTARAEGVEAAAAAAVRALDPGADVSRRVRRAVLLRMLDARDGLWLELLAGDDEAALVLLLGELGELKLLRHTPSARLDALGDSPSARVRAALAEAAGQDGERSVLRHAIRRLSDPSREVRIAAASALLPHDPNDLKDYDYDATPTWAPVQERLSR